MISVSAASAPATAASAGDGTVAVAATPAVAPTAQPEGAVSGATENQPPVRVAAPVAAEPASAPRPPTVPASAPSQPAAPSRPPPAFGSTDPNARARRLARALVSDMVMYHPDRRERGLRDGTLRQEFREEIKKSWEEYVDQVGAKLAQSSPHFRDALNDVLANGQKVF